MELYEIEALCTIRTEFDIRDIAKLVNKQTQTIRTWERKGIIQKCETYSDNKWRSYDRKTFAKILKQIVDYKWTRQVIHNPGQLLYAINLLKEEH